MDKRNRKKKTVDDTVCEIHKFSGYAVLSNCFVRSTKLGWPAIGLLARVMDLPPHWNFTKAGLIAICPDGETAIDTALAELKEWGYLEIKMQMPNESPTGRIRSVYTFYEYSAKDTSIPQYDYELETFTVDNAVLNRVKKDGNFTMVSNKLLRNKELPNKLLGFLLKVLSLPNIDVAFPDNGGSRYSSTLNKIYIEPDDEFDWDVIQHEYGHYVQDQYNIENSPGGSHSSLQNLADARNNKSQGVRLAWGEGWATYFAINLQKEMNASSLYIPNVGDAYYQDVYPSNTYSCFLSVGTNIMYIILFLAIKM